MKLKTGFANKSMSKDEKIKTLEIMCSAIEKENIKLRNFAKKMKNITSKLVVTFNLAELNHIKFEILNPDFIPGHGTVINFKWSDFINNKEHLKAIEKAEQHEFIFIADISFKYEKDLCICACYLVDELTFEKMYKR